MSNAGGRRNDGTDRVHIFDTTLRDGEQSPGISLNAVEKLEIAQQLARLGVDVIEAGFPVASPGDFEAVEKIAQTVEGPVICGLARTHKADVDAAWGAIKDAERPRIHTFISTSDIHIEHQLRTTREDVKGQAKAAVAQAKSYTDDVEFSPMDATRADIEYTAEVCAIAVEEGATVLSIADTVGYTIPEEYVEYFRRLRELVPGGEKVEFSVHCHDDLGMAVANSFAGLQAGARQVECAINGLGERAGNCSLEEIVMLLRTRSSAHRLDTGINTKELARTSRMVSRFTGYAVSPNKAVVGRNAFAHESGIHQDGVLKERSTYEIMDPTEVGLDSNSIVLGKHSGRHALRDALSELGFAVEGNALNQAFRRFKEIADKKKQVTALDLEAILGEEMRERVESYTLTSFSVTDATGEEPQATVAINVPSGETKEAESTGDGPVEAIFSAILAAAGADAELREYRVGAVTGGEDALGEVTVTLRADGRVASGQGVSTSILEASARAYVRALSNLLDGGAIQEAKGATAEGAGQRTAGP
jgi:2-isopropylmalate synthase